MEFERYHRVAIFFHWLIAALVLANLALGLVMVGELLAGVSTSLRYSLYQWHKTLGVMVLLFTLGRIYWRITHHPPMLPPSMPAWERRAANYTHFVLYFFMLALPLTGWLMVSASTLNIPTLLFGAIPWPHLPIKPWLADQAGFAKQMSGLHGLLAYIFIALLALHIGAALRHYFWLKDQVLQRMLPKIKVN